MSGEYEMTLDTSGLVCPYPLLNTKKKIGLLKSGDILKIISTDPSSVVDFKVFALKSGHALIRHEINTEKNQFIFWLKKV